MCRSFCAQISNNPRQFECAKGRNPLTASTDHRHSARTGPNSCLTCGAERYWLVSVRPIGVPFEKGAAIFRVLLRTPILRELTIEFFNLFRLAGNSLLGLYCGFFQHAQLVLQERDAFFEDSSGLNSGQGTNACFDGGKCPGNSEVHKSSPGVEKDGVGTPDSTSGGNAQEISHG